MRLRVSQSNAISGHIQRNIPENTDGDWKGVKSSGTNTAQSKTKLLGSGWSVPVFSAISELKVGEPGVCMASVSEAKKAIAELKGEKPLAVLCPANIDAKGEEVHVLIEDP